MEKIYRQFFRVCYLMITFLSAALKGGKTSTWRMVSILSGDTPLFFCNGRFSFCFFAFFQKFCFCKCSNRVRLIFASVLLQSFLLHLYPLSAVLIPHLAFFRKFCFLQMFKACPYDICKRFVAKVFCCTCSHCGRFSTCILPFCESFVSANVKNVSVRYLQAFCCKVFCCTCPHCQRF